MSDYRDPGRVSERPFGEKLRRDGTASCPLCLDSTWVERLDHEGGSLGVRPCERCKPDAHRRWIDGHYRKDR